MRLHIRWKTGIARLSTGSHLHRALLRAPASALSEKFLLSYVMRPQIKGA